MAQANKRRRLMMIQRQGLGDVPELIHFIQQALPSNDAARTCILSKSWLHAWSTNPVIRFSPSVDSLKTVQNQRKYMRWIHRTLLTYRRDNLPVTCLYLRFGIHTALHSAYKLIMQATSESRTALNELYLAIMPTTGFTLPDEIFSGENLHTLSVEMLYLTRSFRYSLHVDVDPSIRCTNLRVLKLVDVYITPFALQKLLFTCKLLQKIDIELPLEFGVIVIFNLPYLDELRISNLCEHDNIFELYDVPSLRSLVYDTFPLPPLLWTSPVSFKLGILQSLRELSLDGVSMDDAFSSIIKSNFPFLESLTLVISWCSVRILDITCLTLLSLTLHFDLDDQIDVHVYAPSLHEYSHASKANMPSLLFPTVHPQNIQLCLRLTSNPINELFFLKVREALKLSSKFTICILGSEQGVLVPLDVDILPFPATNVEEVIFVKQCDCALWENSLLFDAVFSICHPMYVKANTEINLKVADYLLNQLMVKENEIGKAVVYCEIRDALNGRWVALTSSSLCLLDTTTLLECSASDQVKVSEFKLSWCSP